MNPFLEDEIDNLRSWDELTDVLGGIWREVRDQRAGVVLTTHFDELLVVEPPGGTAKQRRRLHQLGFRRRGQRCWSWEPPPPDAHELPPPPRWLPPSLGAGWTSSRREERVDRARSEMAVRLLREVYGCSPEHLIIAVVNDDEDEDEDEDWDDDAFPALSCAALEARFGPFRKAGGLS